MTQLTPSREERREHDRKLLRGTAHLALLGQRALKVRTTEISVEGLGIVAMINPPTKTLYEVRIGIPTKLGGTTVIEFQASVTHCIYSSVEKGFKIGLQFTAISPEAESAIAQYIKFKKDYFRPSH